MSRRRVAGRDDALAKPPRERLVAEASRLFYRNGINAVGVDAIVERADVALMTLYKGFGSKDGLIADCLRYLDTRYHAWFENEVATRSADPQARLLLVFDVLDDWFRTAGFRGCAFINASVELSDPGHPGHEAIIAHKQRTRRYLHELATDAATEDPDALADTLMLLIEGAIVTALVERDLDAARRARRAAALMLASAPSASR